MPVYLRVEGDVVGEEDDERLDLREYEVEIYEEPCLFAGLVTIQLGIL